jgi:hypothetical protein
MLAIGNHAEVLAGPTVVLLLVRACTVSSLQNESLLYATRSSALRIVLIAFGNKQAEEAAERIQTSARSRLTCQLLVIRSVRLQHGSTFRLDTCVLLQAAFPLNADTAEPASWIALPQHMRATSS